MNIGIRIVCQPSHWPEMANRLGRLQEALQVELGLPQQQPYWKERRLCLLECSGETDADLDQIESAFRQLCGQEATEITRGENGVEAASFFSIPELLADSTKAFIDCSAFE